MAKGERRAVVAIVTACAIAASAACGGASPPRALPVTTSTDASAALPPQPPAAPRATVDLGELPVTTSPVMFTYAPEPNVGAIVRPLLSREAQRKWAAFETALRDADDDLRRRLTEPSVDDAIRSARHPICGDDASAAYLPPDPIAPAAAPDAAPAQPAPPAKGAKGTARAVAMRAELMKELEHDITLVAEKGAPSLVALAYLEELGPPDAPDPDPARDARREHAMSLYGRVKEKVSLDTPVGWLARARLAGLSESGAAAEEYDALLGADLAISVVRPWVRWLLARPLVDYVRAAGVLRAIALSAETPAEKFGARVEWMVATYDAGNWREALELALGLLRDPSQLGTPHAVFDVAALSIARLGGVERVPVDLPSASLATLMHHSGALALREGDWATTERAAQRLLDYAPESAEAPAAIALLASVRALRGEATEAQALVAKKAPFASKSPWADRLRTLRAARRGFPSDAQIERFASALAAPLPHPPSTDDERAADLRARASGLLARCLARPADAGDPGADGARIEITALTFSDRAPEAHIASLKSAAAFGPAVLCLTSNAPRFFRDAAASARFIATAAR